MPRTFEAGQSHRPPPNKYLRIMGAIWRQNARAYVCPTTPTLSGKRALVTGGDSGIGYGISKGLIERGAMVISASRGVSQMPDEGDRPHRIIMQMRLDLSDLGTVAMFVDELAAELDGQRLDLVFANAGIFAHRYEQSAQGYERTFAVNCLGHHLMLQELRRGGLLADSCRVVYAAADLYVLAGASVRGTEHDRLRPLKAQQYVAIQ